MLGKTRLDFLPLRNKQGTPKCTLAQYGAAGWWRQSRQSQPDAEADKPPHVSLCVPFTCCFGYPKAYPGLGMRQCQQATFVLIHRSHHAHLKIAETIVAPSAQHCCLGTLEAESAEFLHGRGARTALESGRADSRSLVRIGKGGGLGFARGRRYRGREYSS